MLDTMGKLYELVIVARLRKEMEKKGAINDNQYGFRPGRSTENSMEKVKWRWRGKEHTDTKDLCLLVTLDVKNAFNRARWNDIIRKIKRR